MRTHRNTERIRGGIAMTAVLSCFLTCLLPVRAADAPAVQAKSAILIEAETGTVLFERDADRPMKAASTVKIMTALLALETLPPDMAVTVRPEWTFAEGSSMYLRSGQQLTVRELLCGLLLSSGNDAALALAELSAGSEEAFVRRMNERAAQFGMADTVFADASGLKAEGHSVTARDLARLAAAAMDCAAFRSIVCRKTAEAGGRSLKNHNKLLWLDERVCGVKTGYTRAAGRTLVSCAEADGLQLICVTLDDPSDWEDHLALLDWGFESYARPDTDALHYAVPVVSGEAETVNAVWKDAPRLLLKADETIRWEAALPEFVYAPVAAGEHAGVLRALGADGSVLAAYPLVWEKSVPLAEGAELDFWEKIKWSWYFACRHSAAPIQSAFW